MSWLEFSFCKFEQIVCSFFRRHLAVLYFFDQQFVIVFDLCLRFRTDHVAVFHREVTDLVYKVIDHLAGIIRLRFYRLANFSHDRNATFSVEHFICFDVVYKVVDEFCSFLFVFGSFGYAEHLG